MFISKLLPILLSLSIIQPIAPKDPLDVDPSKPLGNVAPIKVSVTQFENTYKKDTLLPQYIPFTPTHTGGVFSELQQKLTVDYLDQKTDERLSMTIHYKIGGDLKIQPKIVDLVNGTKAEYLHDEYYLADFIRFKKSDLIYVIGISKNGRGERFDDLVKVANSLH
ncbi:hypothetical protein [Brevibacillus sp. Leaf182]|uniref:hypothetical protein n=1 Tax=Brevibacillus sp. Leaf182 TaxID=1736290 RepID=UPI0006FD9081|nr:hypothetical protein [Brevibacillus sp. Leaf182]RAT94000.1 hypothetical protein ASG16_027875 [Brevibacillus sp. Leaf182]